MLVTSLIYLSLHLAGCGLVLGAPALFQRQSSAIPPFVKTYAPLVWLSASDTYLPSDISGHLTHLKPEVNFKVVDGASNPLTLGNLDQLNGKGGASVYLTSVDDVTKNPSWLNGIKPDATGKTSAVSCTIVVNDHHDGTVDAFYFYFYSFNLGNKVLGENRGNHVGDWEHNMVRFKNGLPTALWYSQHSFGEAFSYQAVEKQGVRPVAYSGSGTHATYATAGTHDHTIPGLNLPAGPLEDKTDKGTLWDPTLNAYAFSYDDSSKSFTSYDSSVPTNFLNFVGHWGDQQYPGQKEIFGISGTAKYVDGPTGPADKQLQRSNVCPKQDGTICVIQQVARRE